MAHGWNTCLHNIQPLSSDPRTVTAPLDPEENLVQHIESLIEQDGLSNMGVSTETLSPVLNLNSDLDSNSNPSSDSVPQNRYYDIFPWQGERQQIVEADLVKHRGGGGGSSFTDFAPDRSASSSRFPICLEVDLRDFKDDCDMLNPSILEDYSDVSSCSEPDNDRSRSSYPTFNHDSSQRSETQGIDSNRNLSNPKCPPTPSSNPKDTPLRSEDNRSPPVEGGGACKVSIPLPGDPGSLSASENDREEGPVDDAQEREKEEEEEESGTQEEGERIRGGGYGGGTPSEEEDKETCMQEDEHSCASESYTQEHQEEEEEIGRGGECEGGGGRQGDTHAEKEEESHKKEHQEEEISGGGGRQGDTHVVVEEEAESHKKEHQDSDPHLGAPESQPVSASEGGEDLDGRALEGEQEEEEEKEEEEEETCMQEDERSCASESYTQEHQEEEEEIRRGGECEGGGECGGGRQGDTHAEKEEESHKKEHQEEEIRKGGESGGGGRQGDTHVVVEEEAESHKKEHQDSDPHLGAPESQPVSASEGGEDLDGRALEGEQEEEEEKEEEEEEETSMQGDQQSHAPDSMSVSGSEREEDMDVEQEEEEEEEEEEKSIWEENRYTNVSSREGHNEGSVLREGDKEEDIPSSNQGPVDSGDIKTSDAHDAAHKLNDYTNAIDCPSADREAKPEDGSKSSLSIGGPEGSNQTFESRLDFPKNQCLIFQEVIGSCEVSEAESIGASESKEDKSQTEENPSLQNQRTSPFEEETDASSCLEDHQTVPQKPLEPPTLERAGLGNARPLFEGVSTAVDGEEPPMLSMFYGEPLSEEESLSETESKVETRSESNQAEGTEAAQLKSSQHMKRRLHPIVLLKTSKQKDDANETYHCSECQQTAQSADHLLEHHHCSHSQHKFQFCQTCSTYLVNDVMAERHRCGVDNESAELPSKTKSRPQKSKSTCRPVPMCKLCNKTFPRLYIYHSHMRLHSGITPFKCPICGLYFAQIGSMNKHVRLRRCKHLRSKTAAPKQNDEVPSTRVIENKPITRGFIHKSVEPFVHPPDSLYASLPDCYVKLVDISKKHTCGICWKSFSCREKLHKHGHNVHKCNILLKKPVTSSQNVVTSVKVPVRTVSHGIYDCPLCPSVFKYPYHLSSHLRMQCIKDTIYRRRRKAGYKIKCPLCSNSFSSGSNRSRHLRNSCIKEYVLKCGGGERKSDHKENMKQKKLPTQPPPMTSDDKNGLRFKCKLCDAIFSTLSGRYRHMKKHEVYKKSGKKFNFRHSSLDPDSNQSETSQEAPALASEADAQPNSCRFCGKCFSNPYSLKKHTRTHKGDKPYRCLQCGKRFMKQYHLLSHKNVHQRRIQCTVCKKIVPTIGDLLKHRKSHTKKGMLQCPDCPLQFQYPAYLLRHIRSHKRQEDQALNREQQKLQKQQKLQSQQQQIKEEKEEDAAEKKCSVCQEVFPVAELGNHILSHLSGPTSRQCPFCKDHFSSRASLIRHMRIHTGEKPYSCQDCSECFYRQELLVLHKGKCPGPPVIASKAVEGKSMAERYPFKCSYCPRRFERWNRLTKHHDGHDSNTVCPCSKCGQCYGLYKYRAHERVCKFSNTEGGKSVRRKFDMDVNEKTGNVSSTKPQSTYMYSCRSCGKNFDQQSIRNIHERTCNNSGAVPEITFVYTCRNCGKNFNKQTNCNVHEKNCLYTGKKHKMIFLHPCGMCGKKFTRTDNRDVHEKRFCPNSKPGSTPMDNNTTVMGTKGNEAFKHKCPHCSHRFKYRSFLLRHLPSHTGEKPYSCMHCGHKFADRSRFLQHEAFCDGVNRQRPCKSDITTPLSNASGHAELRRRPPGEIEGEYKCKFCTKTFMKSRNLRRHILTHTEVKPYRCKACDSCFSRYDHLELHHSRCKGKRQRLEVRIAKISVEDIGRGWQNKKDTLDLGRKRHMFSCDDCAKSFHTQKSLDRHISIMHATKEFKCSCCDIRFIAETSLKRHRRSSCKRRFINESMQQSLNLEKASVDTLLPRRNRILQRIQLHCRVKTKFRCSYCPRYFKASEQLKVHTRLHTGEKPFGCASCGERYIRRDYLQRHLIKCNGMRGEPIDPELCEQCGEVFSPGELQEHLMSCVVTSKSPSRSPRVSSTYSPPKGFSCADCSSRFLLFSQLQQHFLTAHRADTAAKPPNQPPPLQQKQPLIGLSNVKEEPLDEGYGDKLQSSDNNPTMFDQDNNSHNEVDKPFLCTHCNMRFINKSALHAHMRTHTGQYPFICKKCNKGFWNRNMYRKHGRKCSNHWNSRFKEERNVDTVITSEIDSTLKDGVLVFNQGSKTTGTGVLQTNFSCKDEHIKTLKPQDSTENQQDRSTFKEKKAVQYQCSECDKSFSDGLLLISHLEDHGREDQEQKNSTCSKCGKVCASQGQLVRHMKVHTNEKTYSCPECSQTFLYSSDLDIHRTCHDPNRPFVCTECQQRFWTSQSLDNHFNEAHPKEVYTCHFCKKGYALRSSLVRHCRMMHPNGQLDNEADGSMKEKEASTQEVDIEVEGTNKSEAYDDNDDDDDDEPANETDGSDDNDSDSAPYFPCHVCSKTFLTLECLEDHQRCHTGEKPHECAECGKCFFQAAQLQQHERSHKSEFQCQTCGRGFVSVFALRKHKHSHGKSRPHRCPKCQLCFKGLSQLAEHMATHRDDNFPCDLCDRTFSCKISRIEHRKIHTEQWEEKTSSSPPPSSASSSSSSSAERYKYRCDVCTKCFKDPEQRFEHGCKPARERPHRCQDCNKHFLHGSHLKKHQLSHHQGAKSSQYQCDQCHMTFIHRAHFLLHLKRHGTDEAAEETKTTTTAAEEGGAEKIYKCPICPHRFAHAMELARHLSVHSENSHACRVCKMAFPSKSKLAEHERCHQTAAMQYECTECGQSFLGSDAFRKHRCARRQRAVTDGERPNQSTTTKPPPPVKSEQAADEEIEVDVGEDFYICPICSKRFSSQFSLQEHQSKQHNSERPFKCPACKKAFTQKRYLQDHERRHCYKADTRHKQPPKSTDNQFKCSLCPRSLASTQELATHMRKHAEQDVGEHRCDMCYKSFSRLSLLRQHQESHVGQVVYECTECDKAFAFPHLLDQHQKSHAAPS